MNKQHGFVKVAACSPKVVVGNPDANVDAHIRAIAGLRADVVVFPELSITGYTCGDLFKQETLLAATQNAICKLCNFNNSRDHNGLSNWPALIIVGAPFALGNQLFNCAFVINPRENRLLGIIPKQNIPTYKEFYEGRWFRAGREELNGSVVFANATVPFGTDLLFKLEGTKAVVGVEICEDLWMPIPPSSKQALAGANILVNLSASPETVGKNEYRRDLVVQQSGRCVSGYVYSAAAKSESTDDLVFGGHSLIAENGSLAVESDYVGSLDNPLGSDSSTIVYDFDVQKLQNERRESTSIGEASNEYAGSYRMISFISEENKVLNRRINPHPFVPSDTATLSKRCAEVFGISCAGLSGRLSKLGWPNIRIGISGGLDSTFALLVVAKAYKAAGQLLSKIQAITMPGFGTTQKTLDNALALMKIMGVSAETIDIRRGCAEMFAGMGHDPFDCGWLAATESYRNANCTLSITDLEDRLLKVPQERIDKGDLKFENVQARIRTSFLMNGGFTIGTGDMSELALGWCTYNGDHMSMYNPNCSIPKTLIRFLVRWVADNNAFNFTEEQFQELRVNLHSIADTIISPELLPKGRDGGIVQSTESMVGPYELNDFFLFHFVRNGFAPDKILFLAKNAKFDTDYSDVFIRDTLETFIKRFFSQQFKRNCVPNGPKVGSVSLSPRGDWRMPSDASADAWLRRLDIQN